ncbi:hypothetical protein IL306_013673 [Fusarium sp. DS 682]|nr:hypothetical protein IL306_013673 [Fusarium sp. DS 682]
MSTTGTSAKQGEPLFKCGQCHRSFSRVDHLARHVRIHPAGTSGRSARAAHACLLCASSKLRCGNERPCARCAKKGVPCEESTAAQREPLNDDNALSDANLDGAEVPFSYLPDRPIPVTTGPQAESRTEVAFPNTSLAGVPNFNHVVPQTRSVHISDTQPVEDPSSNQSRAPVRREVSPSAHPETSRIQYEAHQVASASGQFEGLLNNLLFTSPNDDEVTQGPVMPSGPYWDPFGTDVHDATMFDPNFEQDFPDLEMFASVDPDIHQQSHAPEQVISAEGVKAFSSSSTWRWVPNASDTGAAQEPNPSALPQQPQCVTTGYTSQLSPEVLRQSFRAEERSRVLSMLIDQCDKKNVVRIATSFPSHHFLEHLFHVGLQFQSIASPLQFIHVPTFEPSSTHTELLSALVACGAFLSPEPAIQSLGCAMPELVHGAIQAQWIRRNSSSRDLDLMQAYALLQHIMLWSGSERRMEIGESHLQPIVTIFRRAGMLYFDHYKDVTPQQGDTAEKREQDWKDWAQQESRIRTIHEIFVHGAATSMSRFVNPILPCAEMTLPLPSSNKLWYATSAEEWHAVWLALHKSEPQTRTSLADITQQLLIDKPRMMVTSVDSLSPEIRLLRAYGLWDTIWHCQQIASWLSDTSLHTTVPGLSAQIEATARALHASESHPDASHDPQDPCALPGAGIIHAKEYAQNADLVHHYLNLALAAPLKRLSAFAGREGESEARRVLPALQEWVSGRDARRSLWHASMILSYARELVPGRRRNIFVLMIFHAGLVFWTYGVLLNATALKYHRRHENGGFPQVSANNGAEFRLDGTLSQAAERFIACGIGSPVMLIERDNSTRVITVTDHPAVLLEEACLLLMRSDGGDLPHFTSGVAQLMSNLVQATQAVGYG